MAKKRFSKKAIGNEIQNVGFGAAGAIGGTMVGNMIPIADARIKAAIPMLLGFILSAVLGKKNEMFKKIGLGMSIGGALSTVKIMAPGIPLLAGDDIGNVQLTADDVQQALITGEITPQQAGLLLNSPELMGATLEFAGEDEALEYAPSDDWVTTEG